ncbi:MAG: hypothetical protein AAF542_26025 [Pseudomonadota bacterium]
MKKFNQTKAQLIMMAGIISLLTIGCTSQQSIPEIAEQAVDPTATATQTQQPTATPQPSETPEPTVTPTATASPQPTATATPARFVFEHVSLQLDPNTIPELFPTLSENGDRVTFFFADGGFCVVQGCIQVISLEQTESEVIITNAQDVETAVFNQDLSYQFDGPNISLIIQSQTERITGNQLSGLRAITYKTQNFPFVNNEGLLYEFRGLTSDGQHYIWAFIPVALPFLPDTYDLTQLTQPEFAVPLPELPADPDELFPILEQYHAEVAVFIDEATADTFTPNLTALDILIQSIEIKGVGE